MKRITPKSGLLGISAVLLSSAGPAFAQSPDAAARAGEPSASLWSIIYQGLEWPAFFIILGSVAALALIVEHFINIRQVTISPPRQVQRARKLIESRNFRGCYDEARRSSTFFARVLAAALAHARHGFDAMHEAALEKSHERSGQLFRRVEYLNMLGNLGPLMGLLGTVWGMIFAFAALGQGGGEAQAGELARGISLALVNTLLGLILAVIGLGFYSVCRNRIDGLTTSATVDVLDLLEYFRPSGRRSGGTSAPEPPASSASREAAYSTTPRGELGPRTTPR